MSRIFATIGLALAAQSLSGQHQTATLTEPYVNGSIPYTVEMREVSLAPAILPNIHSVAAAEWQGQWILLGGRTNGLHGMTGMNAFDPLYENREVWVIDPESKQSWHKSLEDSPSSGLGQGLVDSLSAVNTQFYQENDKWIIVGGYGYKRSVADHVTYSTITLVDLPGLANWVKEVAGSETSLAIDHIDQISDNYFQVTGGGLEKIGDEFQLIFGQNYSGRYRPFVDGLYTKQVRRFKIDTDDGFSIPEESKIATVPNEAFRRRDLNVLTILEREGISAFSEKALILSGVFTPDTGVWTAPVLVEASGVVEMDDPLAETTLRQGFQIYHCSKASLYDRVTGESHMLLFGGITVLERNLDTNNYVRDDQAPFTNQCSLVVSDANGLFTQYWLPTRFPDIRINDKALRFGTNAELFLSMDAPKLHPKVIDLASIRAPTVIGHIFGGLFSDAGNGGNTGASGRVFEVLIVPTNNAAALTISNGDSLKLEWESTGERFDLIEYSNDARSWQELTGSLSNASQLPVAEPEKAAFYRRLSTHATSP